jgi:hypothetical protein
VLGPRLHVVDRVFDIPDGWEIYEGWDYGWANPTVQLVVAIDYTGRKWVVSEYRATETPIPRIAAHAKTIRRAVHPGGEEPPEERPFFGDLTPSASWLDPSAWAKRGEHAAPATSSSRTRSTSRRPTTSASADGPASRRG